MLFIRYIVNLFFNQVYNTWLKNIIYFSRYDIVNRIYNYYLELFFFDVVL